MKKLLIILLVFALGMSIFACTQDKTQGTEEGMQNSEKTESGDTTEDEIVAADPIEVEIFRGNYSGRKPMEKDDPVALMIAAEIGVLPYIPNVPWEGGTAFLQRLNPRIASGDIPDVVQPYGGVEQLIIDEGGAADITTLLQEYAPTVYSSVNEEVWQIVKSADTEGQGRIFFVPDVRDYVRYAGLIRQDWLDNVGKDSPTTVEEYIDVLKAFRDQDANGNGDTNDEIPTSGREFARWMDHLFAPYGVAMYEGYPVFDVYDGELTYSGVTDNMKAAIEFCAYLYSEQLLDNDVFINKRPDWMGKIIEGRTGSWFHIPYDWGSNMVQMKATDENVELSVLPLLKAEGFDGYYTESAYVGPKSLIANKGEEKVVAALKLFEWVNQDENFYTVEYGMEGRDYELDNGAVILPEVDESERPIRLNDVGRSQLQKNIIPLLDINIAGQPDEDKWAYESAKNMLIESSANAELYVAKAPASDGMPASVYGDYADIKSHLLYQEYVARIITGEWGIEKFDEFVEKWYSEGGQEVTDNAREWYSNVTSR